MIVINSADVILVIVINSADVILMIVINSDDVICNDCDQQG